MKYLSFFFLHLLLVGSLFAQNTLKKAVAFRIATPPVIDGILDDLAWTNASIISDFVQYDPIYNVPPTYKTEVRIVYDDYAIYVGAFMFDPNPDSIYKEMGNRDDELNADYFGIEFDTYNNQLDAYTFSVSASGTQSDSREWDDTYNAVWRSATKITNNGWYAEFQIPYSAIRFANVKDQIWGMEIFRSFRRIRETDFWALQVRGAENDLVYWGKLSGISDIKSPVRLSATPYISLYGEHFPYNTKGESNYSTSYSGGLDLKYGINESFTLDMTLLPDFSQVQSDNKVKNLSAFETVYSEQRPFFNEAVDLFAKGDLFYSRRIGRTPMHYYDLEDQLKKGEKITNNPDQAKLLNATKISGRNKNGLAIGFFNAITDNTYATIEDSLGAKHKKLTEPFTNYNILVFDQALKNNSSIYFINTNVKRSKKYDDANITGSGISLVDKSNTYKFSLNGALSQKYEVIDSLENTFNTNLGSKYNASISKVNGNFQFSLNRNVMDNHYDANDLGLTLDRNYCYNSAVVKFNVYEPFWRLRNIYNTLSFSLNSNYTTTKNTYTGFSYNMWTTLLSYLSVWFNAEYMIKGVDYYEPRVNGKYYNQPSFYNLSFGYSSDYRKKIALDGSVEYVENAEGYQSTSFTINPIVKATPRFKFDYSFSYTNELNSKGYATIDTNQVIIFGNREINTIENTLNARYMFMNDLSLTLRVRHYWSEGKYNKYYNLEDDGNLTNNTNYNENNDFNFNAFNIDMVFNWQFSPGSNLSLVWKNQILNEDKRIEQNYFDNLNRTFEYKQLNGISLKLLYYLDYQYLMKKKK